MNRGELQELATIRLEEARILLESNLFDGAYYLSGYVVECGLKAWIAKNTKQYDFPDKKMIDKIYTHNLNTLLGVVGYSRPPEEIDINWAVVKDWSERARYSRHSEKDARDIFEAVADPEEGVLRWIKQHW
ncbi:HEPN domain-containing protein [Bacillus sp. 03113]|uniref:HEPN domain-containing protein n=1 Tax=Bacillus sp. 03113 TaxID=2578211 RepID=UPI001143C604|nr:HEPN domain-containing protein [Bacillus sp. 03113]